jgi:hypothetical protein
MEKRMYGTQDIRELNFDACQCLCDRKKRLGCDKKEECLQQLCGNDERKIGKVDIFADAYSDKNLRKIERAVDKWRKIAYLKCRPIRLVIERAKR